MYTDGNAVLLRPILSVSMYRAASTGCASTTAKLHPVLLADSIEDPDKSSFTNRHHRAATSILAFYEQVTRAAVEAANTKQNTATPSVHRSVQHGKRDDVERSTMTNVMCQTGQKVHQYNASKAYELAINGS